MSDDYDGTEDYQEQTSRDCALCFNHYGDGTVYCDQGKPVNSPHRKRPQGNEVARRKGANAT